MYEGNDLSMTKLVSVFFSRNWLVSFVPCHGVNTMEKASFGLGSQEGRCVYLRINRDSVSSSKHGSPGNQDVERSYSNRDCTRSVSGSVTAAAAVTFRDLMRQLLGRRS